MATNLKTVEKVLDELPDDTLHRAMARAFAEIEAATKGAENPAFKQGGKASKYANLGAVIDAVKPALVNHGLFVTQHCHPDQDGVSVETVLHHRSGESLSMGTLYVPANKRDPQGFGSALTYARRYCFQTAFVVPTEDDDGNAAVATMPDFISDRQRDDLEALASEVGADVPRFCKYFGVKTLSCITADRYDAAVEALKAKKKEPANV
jgi:hypothetical protein